LTVRLLGRSGWFGWGSDEGDILNVRTTSPNFWRWLLGLLLLVGLSGSAEASGGVVITDIIGGDSAVVIDSSGRIVTAGTTQSPATGFDALLLVRNNSDGSPDTSYGNGGLVITDISGVGNHDWLNAIAIDSVGRIVVAGYTQAFARPGMVTYPSIALARYNSDGSLDATFGNSGIVTTHGGPYSSVDSSQAVSIDSLGRIVVAGYSDAHDTLTVLARYNPDGSLDNTFGEPAPVATSLQFDQSIVAAGFSYSANFSGVNLTDETFFDDRFTAPGSNDSAVAVNWQKGLAANHSVPAGITSGTWTINGVRAHKIETDHGGDFVGVSAMITVSQ